MKILRSRNQYLCDWILLGRLINVLVNDSKEGLLDSKIFIFSFFEYFAQTEMSQLLTRFLLTQRILEINRLRNEEFKRNLRSTKFFRFEKIVFEIYSTTVKTTRNIFQIWPIIKMTEGTKEMCKIIYNTNKCSIQNLSIKFMFHK